MVFRCSDGKHVSVSPQCVVLPKLYPEFILSILKSCQMEKSPSGIDLATRRKCACPRLTSLSLCLPAWLHATSMSFFGFENSSLEDERRRFLESGGKGAQQDDVAVYTWGEESYDGLGDALQEGGDDLNDETFGGGGAVGTHMLRYRRRNHQFICSTHREGL